jgi:hypothetical protein
LKFFDPIYPPAGWLQILDAEEVAFSLKSVCSDGTYQIVLLPDELLEKLAALVPLPRLNLVRYHRVLAPNAVVRAQIVAGPREEVEMSPETTSEGDPILAQRRHRLAWASGQSAGQ